MKTPYKCILFDLDHTLWDYESNSAEALRVLYEAYELQKKGSPSVDVFLKNFVEINTAIWVALDEGRIHKDVVRLERFHRVFQSVGIDDYALSLKFSDDYISESPKRKNLLPNAIEVLDYLHPKYPMFIITNGFDEIQGTKMSSSGITHYFKNVVTSEKANARKPEKEIFEYVLTKYGFRPNEAIMIGDNLLTDVKGAQNANIDCVFYNPNKVTHSATVNHEIHDLLELKNIL